MAAKQQSNHQVKSEGEPKYGLKYDVSLNSRIEWMINNKFMSDITFLVGPEKQRIYAHKLHLFTASEYFYDLSLENYVPVKFEMEIELKDEDPEIFLTILRVIYGAKVEISYENLRDMHDHMRKYRLTIEHCKPLIDFLTDQIVDKDTAMKIFRENQYYQFQRVDEACLSYIQTDPLYFFRKDDFTTLEQERMGKIVGLQKINCTEDQLLCALEKWKLANPKSDATELQKLANETKRSYFSHKLLLLVPAAAYDEIRGDGSFTIKLKTPNPVSVYGLGVYLQPSEGDVSVKLSVQGTDEVYREISSLNFVKRCSAYTEVVDLMFEEIVFVIGIPRKFRLEMQNTRGYIGIFGDFQARSTHEKISFACGTDREHAIAHLWMKFPVCGLKQNQSKSKILTPLCCHKNKKQ